MDIDSFTKEVLEVRHCIHCGQIIRFDDACSAYKKVQFTRYEETDKNEAAKKTLVSLLGNILRCAN